MALIIRTTTAAADSWDYMPRYTTKATAGIFLKRKTLVTEQKVGIGEASKKLGLSRTSVQKLVDTGQLIAVKTTGGHRRILQSSLDQLDEKMGPKAVSRLAATIKNTDTLAPGFNAAHSTASDLTVLIVEDDAVASAAISASLSELYPEISCVVATDGLDAVLHLERHRPDILITDLNMTPFDGFRLLSFVTSRAEYQSLLIVVISGLSEQDIDAHGGLPPNVLLYRKPLNMDRLKGFFDAHIQVCRRPVTRSV
jgi:excisionase family DNA binding protein